MNFLSKKSLVLGVLFLITVLNGWFFVASAPDVFAKGLVPCNQQTDDTETQDTDETQVCTTCHFFVLLQNIISFVAFQFVPAATGILVVIAGGMMFLGGAKPDLFQSGKKMLTNTFIGLVIFYGSYAITNTVLAFTASNFTTEGSLTRTFFRNWANIECTATIPRFYQAPPPPPPPGPSFSCTGTNLSAQRQSTFTVGGRNTSGDLNCTWPSTPDGGSYVGTPVSSGRTCSAIVQFPTNQQPAPFSVNVQDSASPPNPATVSCEIGRRPPPGGRCVAISGSPGNFCSVENLQNTCFANVAEQASSICSLESVGGQPAIPSGSDLCLPDRIKISWGLFQINLTANKIIKTDGTVLDCPSAFTAVYTSTNHSCAIKAGKQALYEQCVAAAIDPANNINTACDVYRRAGNCWTPWGAWHNYCTTTFPACRR